MSIRLLIYIKFTEVGFYVPNFSSQVGILMCDQFTVYLCAGSQNDRI